MAAEAIYFVAVLGGVNNLAPSEAIVVFRGNQARIAAGYALARQGVAPLIMVSPASERQRRGWDRRYGLPENVGHLEETQARTTMENARQAARIIREEGLKSVTLVTSDYHMPRSLGLLKLFLWGQGVEIRPFKVRPAGVRPSGYRMFRMNPRCDIPSRAGQISMLTVSPFMSICLVMPALRNIATGSVSSFHIALAPAASFAPRYR